MSNLPQKAEMPKGCLFPDLIPNRDVSQRYLAKLTREGSYSTGGFHCLSLKDRSTWGNVQTVHIYYIHIQTVVREVNKGLKCVNLIWQCLLPLARDWFLLELSPPLEPTREVLPQTVENLKWPGVRGLLGLATTATAAGSVPPCEGWSQKEEAGTAKHKGMKGRFFSSFINMHLICI